MHWSHCSLALRCLYILTPRELLRKDFISELSGVGSPERVLGGPEDMKLWLLLGVMLLMLRDALLTAGSGCEGWGRRAGWLGMRASSLGVECCLGTTDPWDFCCRGTTGGWGMVSMASSGAADGPASGSSPSPISAKVWLKTSSLETNVIVSSCVRD